MVSARTLTRLVVPALLLATQLGCSALGERFRQPGNWFSPRPAAQPSQPSGVFTVDPDSTGLPWANDEAYFIVVKRSCGRLDLYRWGQLVRRYPAVFGRNPMGSKLYEGDGRTPIGFYTIIGKRAHARWARFLLIDYPNATDVVRYQAAWETGDLPQRANGVPGIGGAIGIHGSDKEYLNEHGIDWTLGCISLSNPHVVELDALVPVGTPVLIQE